MLTFLANDIPIWPTGDEVIKSLLPNPWVFLAHIIATIVILIVIIRFMWKPFLKILKDRNLVIEANINESEVIKQDTIKKSELVNNQLVAVKNEAARTIESATLEAYRVRKELEDEARKYVARLRTDAQQEIINNEKELRQNISEEIVSVAFLAVEKLLREKLDSGSDKKMLEEFINDVEKMEIK